MSNNKLNKEDAILSVNNADTLDPNWIENIIDRLGSDYARGYMTCAVERLYNSFTHDEEEFKEAVIEILETYSIWK